MGRSYWCRRALAAIVVVSLAQTGSAQDAVSVEWTDLVDATAAGQTLAKVAGCDGCAAGAHSVQSIDSGDGYVDFTPAAGHRLFVGFGNNTTASTAPGDIGFAFSFWPDGGWDVREGGVYRFDGRFGGGDRFRVAIESGTVRYYQNGALVFTSGTAPAYPLVVDVSLVSLGASVDDAVIRIGTFTSPTPPPPTDPEPPPPGDVDPGTNPGPYDAIIDRVARPKPGSSAPTAAGAAGVDEAFGSRLLRVTDAATRPGTPNRSYTTPSSSHQNAWNTTSRLFYVQSTDGTVLPYAFDPATMTSRRLRPTATGDGGLRLTLGGEPQFSFVDENTIYGVYNGAGANLHTVAAYNFASDTYTALLDLETVVAGLAGTYIGGLGSSAGPVERLAVFFGGPMQGQHRYIVVFDRANPGVRRVLDTVGSTIDGVPANILLNFRLHAMFIDKSGQYVMFYPPSADRQPPRSAAPAYLWNLSTNQITELPMAEARVSGHDGFGYGYLTNQDCCTTTTWDAAQWQLRSLAAPFATRDLVNPVLTPQEVQLADHQSWTHAQPSTLVPVVSATYRYGNNTTAWRAWDDEIIAIQTDAAPGQGAVVWRFAHHRSDVRNDNDPAAMYFWYTPRAMVSQDGRWALFTSNWDKSLGIDGAGVSGGMHRQDVFLVELEMLGAAPAPLEITTTALPDAVAGTRYSVTLAAAGGAPPLAWQLAAGGLPPGLSLDPSGLLVGTPTASGTSSFTIRVTDAALPPQAAEQPLTLTVTPRPPRRLRLVH